MPLLIEVKVEIEDVIAASYGTGDNETESDWGTIPVFGGLK